MINGRRAIDTSTLGPIRIELPRDRTPRSRAREAYADKIEAQGPAYHNAAHSIRAGWENIWIKAGIDALADAMRMIEVDS